MTSHNLENGAAGIESGVVGSAAPAEAAFSCPGAKRRDPLLLFLASFLALYFELVIIRYLGAEVPVFAYLKNLPLIASFLGLGLGMALGRTPRTLKGFFPVLAAVIFVLIANASLIHLDNIPFPGADYFVWGPSPRVDLVFSLDALRFLGVVLGFLALVVAFFVALGSLVGEKLSQLAPLCGYGINLAGSLMGILAFTFLAFATQPPVVWILVGFLAAIPFFYRERLGLAVFALTIFAIGFPASNTTWSPYYRLRLDWSAWPADDPQPSAYTLTADHVHHLSIIDLSRDFTARHPGAEPNRSSQRFYDLPYQLIPHPCEVLVVGAGGGNDVAAALRHGAEHVDAVEIDPVILQIGEKYHPERPYSSSRVTLHVDDARAFFKKTRLKYDLIVFGLLDSVTMLTGYSSVRLDNYVYTVESFREAKNLLRPGGSIVLSFAVYAPFIADRLFSTLTRAFDLPPRAYQVSSDNFVFIEGRARETTPPGGFREVSAELRASPDSRLTASDRWPFLYLRSRTIPQSVLWVLILFLVGAVILLRRTLTVPSLASREHLHLFLLGAGFLLLETKGVTELALLFGSTWVVNSVVIGGFLVMGLLANVAIAYVPFPRRVAYGVLFIVLAVGIFFPYSSLGSLPTAAKVLAAAVLAGLPVFFSGLVFSRSFRDVGEPAKGLGVNLLGAVVGGSLENAVMIGGTSALGWLAVLLYALSAVFLKTR